MRTNQPKTWCGLSAWLLLAALANTGLLFGQDDSLEGADVGGYRFAGRW